MKSLFQSASIACLILTYTSVSASNYFNLLRVLQDQAINQKELQSRNELSNNSRSSFSSSSAAQDTTAQASLQAANQACDQYVIESTTLAQAIVYGSELDLKTAQANYILQSTQNVSKKAILDLSVANQTYVAVIQAYQLFKNCDENYFPINCQNVSQHEALKYQDLLIKAVQVATTIQKLFGNLRVVALHNAVEAKKILFSNRLNLDYQEAHLIAQDSYNAANIVAGLADSISNSGKQAIKYAQQFVILVTQESCTALQQSYQIFDDDIYRANQQMEYPIYDSKQALEEIQSENTQIQQQFQQAQDAARLAEKESHLQHQVITSAIVAAAKGQAAALEQAAVQSSTASNTTAALTAANATAINASVVQDMTTPKQAEDSGNQTQSSLLENQVKGSKESK